MSSFYAFLSLRAHGATRTFDRGVTQARRYSVPQPPFSRTVHKLRDAIGRPEARTQEDDRDKQSAVPALLLQDQAKPEAQARAQETGARNGDFFTILIELHEWRDPFQPARTPSGTAVVVTEKHSSPDRGFTAADAAEAYHNGACFAAWPVGEDGGNWRSVCTKPWV